MSPKFSPKTNNRQRLRPASNGSNRSNGSSIKKSVEKPAKKSSSVKAIHPTKNQQAENQQSQSRKKGRKVARRPLSATLSNFWEEATIKIGQTDAIPLAIQQIQFWTNDQPILVQFLCEQVLSYGPQMDDDNAITLVDRIVHKGILIPWKKSSGSQKLEYKNSAQKSITTKHLQEIATQIRQAPRKDLLLLRYLKILQQGSTEAAQTDEQERLVRSGLVVKQGQTLEIANPIYARAFDIEWIEREIPGITRPVNIVTSQPPQNTDHKIAQETLQKTDQKTAQKTDHKIAQRITQKATQKITQPTQKTDHKIAQKPPQKAKQKTEQKTEQNTTPNPNPQNPDQKTTQRSPETVPFPAQPVPSPDEPLSKRPSVTSGLYSKLAVFVCCTAVAAAAVSAYRQGPENSVSTSSSAESSVEITPDTQAPGIANSSTEGASVGDSASTAAATEATLDNAAEAQNREWFDQGVAHATNSRWLPMVRNFCKISPNSTYFTPAKKQVQQWVKLYREDVEIAKTAFLAEDIQGESGGCSIISDALAAGL